MSHDPKINIRATIAKSDRKLKPQAHHTIPPWVEKKARLKANPKDHPSGQSDPRDDPHRAKTLRRRRTNAVKRVNLRPKARWEHERSFERAQTFFALEHFDEIAEKRRLRATKCGADIWPLRPPVGRYEEMW